MLFSTFTFVYLFLPVVLLGYFLLQKRGFEESARGWLVLASLFFYGYWNPIYLPLLVGSVLINFAIAWAMMKHRDERGVASRWLLVVGVGFNLSMLGFFKYTDFFIRNVNGVFGSDLGLLHLALPLAISFFTFQQIAYIVDCYRGQVKERNLLHYSLFVSFFGQLIAGPIVHHREMLPQFVDRRLSRFDWDNFAVGLLIFALGLTKKVVIADSCGLWANTGYEKGGDYSMAEAWATSGSYSLQLYFDFSGYTDMAIGAARMFNIQLPQNFNSPYKATNIQDFWRRWHMTLSRFLKEYLYVPLGGNRRSEGRTAYNLFMTFLLGGLWHGAGWTFVAWGAMHGGGTVVHRQWRRTGRTMPGFLAWPLTFLFVHLAWVFFRATSFEQATAVLSGMVNFDGIGHFGRFAAIGPANRLFTLAAIVPGFLACFLAPNSTQLADRFTPHWRWLVLVVGLLLVSTLFMNSLIPKEFLYFDF